MAEYPNVLHLESGYLSASKPNFEGSGLPGSSIRLVFLPLQEDIEECKRQAHLWTLEPQTKTFTYRYGPVAILPSKFL